MIGDFGLSLVPEDILNLDLELGRLGRISLSDTASLCGQSGHLIFSELERGRPGSLSFFLRTPARSSNNTGEVGLSFWVLISTSGVLGLSGFALTHNSGAVKS